MLLLARMGFRVVGHLTVSAAELTLERLSDLLAARRARSEFEIAG